jgi:ArsR family metal-binding transcriptional regulator
MLRCRINSISRNHEFLILKENAMTATIAKLVERLAEMFPKQNYQSKLDAYLTNKNVKDISDVEHWTREFDRRGSYL